MTPEERMIEIEKLWPLDNMRRDILVRMFQAAVAEEREACAKILDREADQCEWYNRNLLESIAEEIRARGEKESTEKFCSTCSATNWTNHAKNCPNLLAVIKNAPEI